VLVDFVLFRVALICQEVKSKDMSEVLITKFMFGVTYTVPLIGLYSMLGVIMAMVFSLEVSSRHVFVLIFNISNFSCQGQSGTLFYHDAFQSNMF
jgi:hypothetical protein